MPNDPSDLMVPNSGRIRGLADALDAEGIPVLAALVRGVAEELDEERSAP